MGSGNLPAGTTVRSITAVVAPEQILTISKKKRANDGTVTVGGVYSNQAVTTGFYFRELGLYAKAVYPDGREIPEVLYSYGNAGSTADYMTAYTSGQPVEREIDLVVYIGNDTVVDLTIESGVYITREQLEEELQDAIDEVVNGVGATIIREIEIPAEGWTPLDTGPYPYQADVPLPEAKEAFSPAWPCTRTPSRRPTRPGCARRLSLSPVFCGFGQRRNPPKIWPQRLRYFPAAPAEVVEGVRPMCSQ